jgi:RNA polymerase sigma factor (sigma-70 family)
MFQCDCPPDNCAGRVACYLAGNNRAGDELVHKFTPLVCSIVQRVLGPSRREEWEDACQTIFLRLFTNLHQWENRCPFCKWLAIVAARRAIDLSRLPDPLPRLPSTDIPDPRCPTLERDLVEKLQRIVERFPPPWREVWEWSRQGMKREEMAQRTGKSLRTIQYWLAEMFDQLREGLQE